MSFKPLFNLLRSSQLSRLFGQCRQSDTVIKTSCSANCRSNHHRRSNLREGQLEATALLGRTLRKDELWLSLLQISWVVVQVGRQWCDLLLWSRSA